MVNNRNNSDKSWNKVSRVYIQLTGELPDATGLTTLGGYEYWIACTRYPSHDDYVDEVMDQYYIRLGEHWLKALVLDNGNSSGTAARCYCTLHMDGSNKIDTRGIEGTY
jgi:hypothetical protein